VSVRGGRWLRFVFVAALLAALFKGLPAPAQDTSTPRPAESDDGEEPLRKVKVRVPPEYPELARRLRIAGAVKIQVVVSPAGKVRSTKVVGGHPLLIQAALDAVRRWKFEPANEESSLVVEVRFKPVATVGS
jgi:TonB family protein